MAELIGTLLILAGAVFHLSAGLGILRMPDAYSRMQAGTKASTLGNTLVVGGIAFFHPDWTLKLLLVIYFVLMTNPIASHALARAAYRIRVPMTSQTAVDALRDSREKSRGGA
jgi:multicomponent Na+:H+ antiporter subunit G